jgi:beta-lactam-binding protein with PASTA domain
MGNVTSMATILMLLFGALLVITSSAYAQEEPASDPWMEEMEKAKGLTVGDLTPKYGGPVESPSGDGSGDNSDSGSVNVTDTGTIGTAGGPVDPNSLDPNNQNVAKYIREWLSIAQPPENAVPGNRFYYDKFGRMRGSGVGMRTVDAGTHDTVDYGTGATPEAKVWSDIRKKLDSINHCTLEEYVVAKLGSQSIDQCAGRYGAVNDLKGFKLSKAKTAVTNKGFTYTLAPGSPAKTPAKNGTIEKQEPPPIQYLKKGDTVKLFVHSPYVPQLPILPDFTGEPLAEAKKWLKKNKLTAKLAPGRPAPSKKLSGTVERQKPEPGTKIGAGETVTLTVYSKFVDIRRVPNVTGLSVGKAKKQLSDAGLKPALRPGGKPSSQQQAGTVERQEPPAGAETAPLAEVLIFVYGPYVATVAVPNVLQLSFEDAKQRLGNAGLTITRKDAGKPQSSSQANTAQKQDPSSGTEVAKGTTVLVWFYGEYIPNREEQLQQADCSHQPNSHKAWDNQTNAPSCFCNQGYVFNTRSGRCEVASGGGDGCDYDITMIGLFMNNYRANPSNIGQKQMAEQIAGQARNRGCDQTRISQALGSGGGEPIRRSDCPPGMIMGTKPGTWGQEEACVPAGISGGGGTGSGGGGGRTTGGGHQAAGVWRLVNQIGPKTEGSHGRMRLGAPNVKLIFSGNTIYYNTKASNGRGGYEEAGISLTWTDPPSVITPGNWSALMSVKGQVTNANPRGLAGARTGISVNKIRGNILKCVTGGRTGRCDNFASAVNNYGKVGLINGEVQISLGDKDPEEFNVTFWITDGGTTLALIREYTYRRVR